MLSWELITIKLPLCCIGRIVDGIMSLVIGLSLGILFSKLFLMLLAKVALLNMRINFFISVKAIVETVVAYLVILFITFLKGYIDVVRTNLID